jgi:hypothetical protein
MRLLSRPSTTSLVLFPYVSVQYVAPTDRGSDTDIVRAKSMVNTRDIADPASKEESFNFHYADHLDIPLHPSRLQDSILSLFFPNRFSEATSVLCFDIVVQKGSGKV